eukprot:PhM_4_TR18032/c1_g1_i1/m.37217
MGHYEQLAIDSITERFTQELSDRVVARTQAYFETAESVLLTYRRKLIYQHDIVHGDIMDYNLHVRTFYETVEWFPAWYAYLYFGSAKDLTAFWGTAERYLYMSVVPPALQPPNCSYPHNVLGTLDDAGVAPGYICGDPYSPTQRPWYTLAANNVTRQDRLVIGDPYPWGRGDMVGYTLSCAVHSASGQMLGVAAVDIDNSGIFQYFSQVRVTPNTLLTLVDRSETIVGAHNHGVLRNNSGELSIMTMRDAAQELDPRYYDLIDMVHESQHYDQLRTVDLDGKKHYLLISTMNSVHDTQNLNWLLILAVPASDVLSDIEEGQMRSTWATVGIVIGMALFAVVLSYVIHRPLRSLSTQMVSVAEMSVEDVVRGSGSWIYEVYTMQLSFYTMVDRLTEFKSYIPSNVFAHKNDELLIGEDDDEPESDVGSRSANLVPFAAANESSSSIHSSSNSTPRTPGQDQKGFGSPPMPPPMLGRPVQRSHVALVVFRLSGYPDAASITASSTTSTATAQTDDITAFLSDHTVLMERLTSACEKHRGVPISVFGERVLVAYNAVRPCGSKVYHACASVCEVHTFMSRRPESGKSLTVVSGMACGYAFCGDYNSGTTRGYGVVGPALSEVMLLERLCAQYDAKCLMTHSLYRDAHVEFNVRARDVLTTVSSTDKSCPPSKLLMYELLGRVDSDDVVNSVAGFAMPSPPSTTAAPTLPASTGDAAPTPGDDGEWMYQLARRGIGFEFNEAVQLMFERGRQQHGEAFITKFNAACVVQDLDNSNSEDSAAPLRSPRVPIPDTTNDVQETTFYVGEMTRVMKKLFDERGDVGTADDPGSWCSRVIL